MYSGLNRVILYGRLGGDPEASRTESGKFAVRLRLATRRSWPNEGGGWEERTDWHRVTVWGERAERLQRTVKKGDAVLIEGHLSYFDLEDGETVRPRQVAINADKIEFLGKRKFEQVEEPSAAEIIAKSSVEPME